MAEGGQPHQPHGGREGADVEGDAAVPGQEDGNRNDENRSGDLSTGNDHAGMERNLESAQDASILPDIRQELPRAGAQAADVADVLPAGAEHLLAAGAANVHPAGADLLTTPYQDAQGAQEGRQLFGGRKGNKKIKPSPREPYGLRSGPRGIISEVIPPTIAARNNRERLNKDQLQAEVEVHAPPRANDNTEVTDRADSAHRDDAQEEEDQVVDPHDEVFVAPPEVMDAEAGADHLEWAARRAYEQTLEHAARRAAEQEEAARRNIANSGNEELAAQVDALYEGIGIDANDDNRRERIASGEILPDEEEEEEADLEAERIATAKAEREFQAARGELFTTIIVNIRRTKELFVDQFDKSKYDRHPEALLKDLRVFQAALIKIAVALAMGRTEHNVGNVDRLAIAHIKEIYLTGPRNLRPLVRTAYANLVTDMELKYELAASIKAVEAAAVAVKRSFNRTCRFLGFDGFLDNESEMSYVTDNSNASVLLRERELIVGQILESVQAEVDIIVPLARGTDRESQIPTDQELYELRADRNRIFRLYTNSLITRWQIRHADRLDVLDPAGAGQRRDQRLPAQESRTHPQVQDEVSLNASTLVEDFGQKQGPPLPRRVRLNQETPEQFLYTPETEARRRPMDDFPPGPLQTPLSSTRAQSRDTSLNTSGFSRGLERGGKPTRIRRHDMDRGSDIASVRSEPTRRSGFRPDPSGYRGVRRLYEEPPSNPRATAERSLNEATSAKDVLEALKLTAQISLSNQRDYGREHIETAVENKEQWYLSLPKPWNVVPNTTEKYSDEMHKIRFLLNKADTEGSQLRRFTGREADYFDWRPVVIHGIHMKNVSIADKFYALQSAFKRREDAFVDSLVRDQDPSPEAYEHIIVQLERQYGGERRAYTHAASALKFKVKLDADNQESVSDTYAEVRKYISFCRKNQMELYLQPGPTASDLIRRFMAQKQIAAMLRFCDLRGLRQEDGSLFQVEAYLSHLLDIFAKEHEITGIQRQPSRHKGAVAEQRPRWSTPGPRTPLHFQDSRGRGNFSRMPYRGASRGYGHFGQGNQGRGNNRSQPFRRVYALYGEDGGEVGHFDPFDDGSATFESDTETEQTQESNGYSDIHMEDELFLNYYEYPSDDETDHQVMTNCRHLVNEEFFRNADEYRVFAQAVSHEVMDCTLCEKKLSKKDKHLLFLCPTFKALTLKEKCQYLQDDQRCFNCLAKGHGSRTCQSKRTCSLCEKRHHSLICVKTAKPGEDVSFIKDRLSRNDNPRGRGRGRGQGAAFRGRPGGRGRGT